MTALIREMDDATAAELDRIGATAVVAQQTATNGAAELAQTSGVSDVAAQTPDGPVITVLRGAPSDVELAALLAVFTALAASAGSARPAGSMATENWGHPTLMHRHSTAFSPTAFAVSPQLRQ